MDSFRLNLPQSKVKANYLHWHKTLTGKLYAMDIDSIEVREVDGELKPVAIIEVQNERSDIGVTKVQSKIYPILSQKLGLPLYLVRTNERLKHFAVRSYPSGEWVCMDAREYEEWLEGLRS